MTRLPLRLLALLLLIGSAGCASEPPSETAGDASPDASNPVASTDTIPESAMRTDSAGVDYDLPVTLVSLEAGDRACYLTVQPAGGPERTEMADFRMCEGTELVGRRVLLTVTPSQVQAASCQGDPECPDTEQVNLVTGMDPDDARATELDATEAEVAL